MYTKQNGNFMDQMFLNSNFSNRLHLRQYNQQNINTLSKSPLRSPINRLKQKNKCMVNSQRASSQTPFLFSIAQSQPPLGCSEYGTKRRNSQYNDQIRMKQRSPSRSSNRSPMRIQHSIFSKNKQSVSTTQLGKMPACNAQKAQSKRMCQSLDGVAEYQLRMEEEIFFYCKKCAIKLASQNFNVVKIGSVDSYAIKQYSSLRNATPKRNCSPFRKLSNYDGLNSCKSQKSIGFNQKYFQSVPFKPQQQIQNQIQDQSLKKRKQQITKKQPYSSNRKEKQQQNQCNIQTKSTQSKREELIMSFLKVLEKHNEETKMVMKNINKLQNPIQFSIEQIYTIQKNSIRTKYANMIKAIKTLNKIQQDQFDLIWSKKLKNYILSLLNNINYQVFQKEVNKNISILQSHSNNAQQIQDDIRQNMTGIINDLQQNQFDSCYNYYVEEVKSENEANHSIDKQISNYLKQNLRKSLNALKAIEFNIPQNEISASLSKFQEEATPILKSIIEQIQKNDFSTYSMTIFNKPKPETLVGSQKRRQLCPEDSFSNDLIAAIQGDLAVDHFKGEVCNGELLDEDIASNCSPSPQFKAI